MINIIIFEMKKYFSRKKNILIIGIFLVCSLIFIKLNNDIDIQYKENDISSIEFTIESLNNQLLGLENEMNAMPENKELREIYEGYTKDVENLKRLKNEYINKNWSEYLKIKIEMDEERILQIKKGKLITQQSIEEIEKQLEMNKILYEKNITPINENASMQGFNFIKVFLNIPMTLIIMVVVIILSADIVSSEFDDKTYKILFTQPISKNKILMGKIISSIMVILSLLLSIIILLYFICGVLYGFGDPDYPTLFNNQYISIIKFDIISLIFLVIFIICIISISIFISTLINNNGTAIATTILLCVSPYIIISKGLLKNVARFIPFSYIDIFGVLNGTLNTVYPGVGLYMGLLILGITIVMCNLMSYIIFNKKVNFE